MGVLPCLASTGSALSLMEGRIPGRLRMLSGQRRKLFNRISTGILARCSGRWVASARKDMAYRARFGSESNRRSTPWETNQAPRAKPRNGKVKQNGKVAFVFPGQGSQYVGMGKDLHAQFAVAERVFGEADEALGFPLSRLCFDGPESDLKLTENTQPAILTVSVAALRVFEAETSLKPDFVAGHSLGEYTSLVCAGALSFQDAVRVVRDRGRLMQQAVPAGVGAMSVILGLEMGAVQSVCEAVSNGEVVAPANYNGGGQIVIAGSKAAVTRAMSIAKKRGAKRVLDLPVSAPFHCQLMHPAAEGLERVLDNVTVRPFSLGVLT